MKGYDVPLHFIALFYRIERQVRNMEIVVNTSKRPYNFSFYVRGSLVTVQLLPGASRVKKEYLPELRKVRMFATLENDLVINAGVKEPDNAMDAVEIDGPAAVPVKSASKKTTVRKVTPKTTKKSGTLDLEDL